MATDISTISEREYFCTLRLHINSDKKIITTSSCPEPQKLCQNWRVFIMAKLTYEDKKEIVRLYDVEHLGYESIINVNVKIYKWRCGQKDGQGKERICILNHKEKRQ